MIGTTPPTLSQACVVFQQHMAVRHDANHNALQTFLRCAESGGVFAGVSGICSSVPLLSAQGEEWDLKKTDEGFPDFLEEFLL